LREKPHQRHLKSLRDIYSILKYNEENFALYQQYRVVIEESLSNQYAKSSNNKTNAGHNKCATQIVKQTGAFAYNPADIRVTVLHKNPQELVSYYNRVRSQLEFIVDAKTRVEKLSVKGHPLFRTSYGFFHNRTELADKELSVVEHFDVGEKKFEAHANSACPVIGFFLNKESLNTMHNQIKDHAMHSMYLRHVLFVLESMSLGARVELGMKDDHTKLSPGEYVLPKPTLEYNHKAPYVVCSGFHEITKFVTECRATISFSENENDGVFWSSLSMGMATLASRYDLQQQTNPDKFVSHRVHKLELTIQITTFCVRPIRVFTGNESVFERVKVTCAPKTILGQYVTVSGKYHGNSPALFQPCAILKFVTTNVGYTAVRNAYEKTKLVMFHFGYGAPMQVEIEGTYMNYFGHNYPHISTELMNASISHAVQELTKPVKGNGVQEQMAVFRPGPAFDGSDSSFGAIKSTVFNSLSKTFNRNKANIKLENALEKKEYHIASTSTRMYSFLVEGSPYTNPFFVNMATHISLMFPQGRTNHKLILPQWDMPDLLQGGWGLNVVPVPQYTVQPGYVVSAPGQGQPLQSVFKNESSEFGDDDFNSIFDAASRPSVFDDEVYM